MILSILLVTMQTGNAWAMTDMSHGAGPQTNTAMIAGDEHGAMAVGVHACGTKNAAATENDCDSTMSSDCASCAHCIAVVIECGTVAAMASLPQADRVTPSATSVKLIHFKPPRFA